MRDVLDDLERRYRAGETVALGTVVSTFRSAPREAGASMLVAGDGTVTGSVSGGCVEGAVYELGQEVIGDGNAVLQRYGVSDDDAFAVGLTCGGIIDVFVERIDPAEFTALGDVIDSIHEASPSRSPPSPNIPIPPWSGDAWWCGPTERTASFPPLV